MSAHVTRISHLHLSLICGAIKKADLTHAKMARFQVGDLVAYKSDIVVISRVTQVLGFCLYSVMDTESGKMIEGVSGTALQCVGGRIDNDSDFATQPNEKKRFAQASRDEIDALAMNASSKNTQKATQWGINIFQGT